MPESVFDADALFVAMDHKRRFARLTWRQVATAAGVSPSTFSRLGLDRASPSVDGLCRMLLWLGTTDLRPFLREATPDA